MTATEREDRDVHLIIASACAAVVVAQVGAHASFDGGATVCLGGAICAIAALARRVRRRPRPPRAWLVR